MALFPRTAIWPEEWLCVCLCDTRESHYLLIHLMDLLQNKGLPVKDVRGPKDRLAIWVPRYIEREAHHLAQSLQPSMTQRGASISFPSLAPLPESLTEFIEIPLDGHIPAQTLPRSRLTSLRTGFHKVSASEWLLICLEMPFFVTIATIGLGFYIVSIGIQFKISDLGGFVLFAYALCWLGLYILSKPHAFIRRSRRALQQRRRNAFTVEVLRQIGSGSKPYPFSLYLRSFDTDAGLIHDRDRVPFTWKSFLLRCLLGPPQMSRLHSASTSSV
jgi:hypothetical protein